MRLSFECCEFAREVHLNAWVLLDSLYQVTRHRFFQVCRAHEHLDARRVLREEHRGLSRGVASSDYNYWLVGAEVRLPEGRVVIKSLAGKSIQVCDGRFVVLRTGGENDCACRNFLPIAEMDSVRPFAAIQALHRACHHDLRTKFFGLGDRTRCQLLPGKTRRKPQIIFDLGTGSRLASRGAFLDHKNVQAFRSSVDGCGQSSRPGAHNNQIANLRVIDIRVEPQALCNLFRRGISQHSRVVADHDGNVFYRDPEPVQQFLRRLVNIQVQISERMPVACQKLPHREGICGVTRAEDNHISFSLFLEGKPSSQKSFHEYVAELRIFSDQGAQLPGAQFEQRSRLRGLAAVNRFPSRNHQQLAGKLADAIRGDRTLFRSADCQNLYAARNHDVNGRRVVARFIENFTGSDLAHH